MTVTTFSSPAFGAAMAKKPPETTVQYYAFDVINTYPHDKTAFTQGLFFRDGKLHETTGQYGQSVLRRVTLDSGAVEKQTKLPAEVFGEGSVSWKDTIIALSLIHI